MTALCGGFAGSGGELVDVQDGVSFAPSVVDKPVLTAMMEPN